MIIDVTFYRSILGLAIITGFLLLIPFIAMAIAQAMIAVVALFGGSNGLSPVSVIEIVGVNGFFITLFIVSALLFRHASLTQSENQFT